MKQQKLTVEDYIKTLITLETKGRDGFGLLGQGVLTALGAAAAAASAPMIASAIGLTSATFLGSTTLAAMLGVAAVTPVGWVAGAAVAGGALCYGIGKIIHGAGKQDERRDRLKEDLEKKIAESLSKAKQSNDSDKVKIVADVLHTAQVQNKIPMEEGARILLLLENKEIAPEFALDTIMELISHKSSHATSQQSTREKELIKRLKTIDRDKANNIVKKISQKKMTLKEAHQEIDRILAEKL